MKKTHFMQNRQRCSDSHPLGGTTVALCEWASHQLQCLQQLNAAVFSLATSNGGNTLPAAIRTVKVLKHLLKSFIYSFTFRRRWLWKSWFTLLPFSLLAEKAGSCYQWHISTVTLIQRYWPARHLKTLRATSEFLQIVKLQCGRKNRVAFHFSSTKPSECYPFSNTAKPIDSAIDFLINVPAHLLTLKPWDIISLWAWSISAST